MFFIRSSFCAVGLYSFASILLIKRKVVDCFTSLIVFLCHYTLSRGAMGWSTVCIFGIPWSYALAFLNTNFVLKVASKIQSLHLFFTYTDA